MNKDAIPAQGWGLSNRLSLFRYFPNFSTSPKYMLAIEYHVQIWQMSPQLSCCDTCQKWMRFKECNRYFCEIKNFVYDEIDERSFSNPHPWHLHTRLLSIWGAQLSKIACPHRNITRLRLTKETGQLRIRQLPNLLLFVAILTQCIKSLLLLVSIGLYCINMRLLLFSVEQQLLNPFPF